MNTPDQNTESHKAATASRDGKRFRIGRWILIASLLFALYAWTFGPYGVVRQQRTAETLRRLELRNDSLRSRLELLEDSLRLLSTDSATIAAEARSLGLVLPGEVAVRFVDTTGLAPARK